LGKRLTTIEPERVFGNRNQQDHQHSNNADNSADIEEAELVTNDVRYRLPEHGHVPDRQQDAKLGGAHLEVGDLEVAKCVAGQADFDQHYQVDLHQPHGDPGGHVARQRESAQKEHGADGIDHVIDVETVARALAVAKAGQRAVHAVTEPV